MQKAIFFDKDGTLVDDVPYNVDPARIRLTRGCETALQRFQSAGYRLVVISNQPGIAQGYFSLAELEKAAKVLTDSLAASGIFLVGFYYCPHHPDGNVAQYRMNCDCRKPAPGMIERAAGEHDIDLSESWMIGDILNDVEAGRRAGCRTILINNGNETEWVLSPLRVPDHIACDLEEAAKHICG